MPLSHARACNRATVLQVMQEMQSSSHDVAAIALLSPRQLIWLLCAATKEEPRGVQKWLQVHMSDLATELFTDILESPLHNQSPDTSLGGLQALRAEPGISCGVGMVKLGPFAAAVQAQIIGSHPGRSAYELCTDTPSEEVSGICGTFEELFEHVYALVDAETLLQKIESRKQRWRASILGEIRNGLM